MKFMSRTPGYISLVMLIVWKALDTQNNSLTIDLSEEDLKTVKSTSR